MRLRLLHSLARKQKQALVIMNLLMNVRRFLFVLCLLRVAVTVCAATNAPITWVRAGLNTNAPVWGLEGGLQFALHPGGFTRGDGGPRGLIRIGYPTLPEGKYDLINFIAVEPIVKGKKGFSELEKSSLDGKPGKLFWLGAPNQPHVSLTLEPGEVTALAPGLQQLTIRISVERFENGAHVSLILAQRSDRPGELSLTVEAEPDSAPIQSCILTATMGNKARTRLLFLSDGPVSSLQMYPEYRDVHFSPHRIFGIDRLPRAANGDVLIAILNDEEHPEGTSPFGRPHFWDYKGSKVAQYWRKPVGELSGGLACAVNGRYTYWGSKQPIPGGIAFENFELREPFRSGQRFVFGISREFAQAFAR